MTPSESTTYHLVAKNDTGTAEATARITVVERHGPPPNRRPTTQWSSLFSQNMKDVFFAYDSYEISPDSEAVISRMQSSCSSTRA